MIVSEPVECVDSLLRVLLPVVVDEGEPLALAGDLVLCQEDASYVAKRLEQLLEIVVLRVFGKVGDADGGRVGVVWKEGKERTLNKGILHVEQAQRGPAKSMSGAGTFSCEVDANMDFAGSFMRGWVRPPLPPKKCIHRHDMIFMP
jgi:hypothetical protein